MKRLTTLLAKTSKNQQGVDRARAWIDAAEGSIEFYGGHPAVAFADLAAEIATEVRLLRAVQAELAAHAGERGSCSRWVDPAQLARSLPGVADVSGPALVAAMGDPARFARGTLVRAADNARKTDPQLARIQLLLRNGRASIPSAHGVQRVVIVGIVIGRVSGCAMRPGGRVMSAP